VTEIKMTFLQLRERLVKEALEANKTTVQEFTESTLFRQWAAAGGDAREESGLRWESNHIPNTQIVTVFPTALEAYKRFGRAVTEAGVAIFTDPTQLLQGFLDLAELMIDLRREGIDLRSVEATTVYFAVKRTGREGIPLQDLAACVSESQYMDQDACKRPFVPKEQVEPIIKELLQLRVFQLEGDRVSVAPEYLG
jgi:hypothetical protein